MSSAKQIGKNRAPRVHIEYDVELYGAQKKVELPFVVGVMSDLSGKALDPLPVLADRKFVEFDADSLDARMKSIAPRVVFQVPNALTGDGSMGIDLTFECMDDFGPAAIARKVDSLNKLLEARQQLANLVTYMDGKSGAEELIARLLADPTLLGTLGAAPKPASAASAPSDASS